MRLEPRYVEEKVKTLMKCYRSQLSKSWFTPDTFRALMRIRGIESGTTWAEGFRAGKVCLA